MKVYLFKLMLRIGIFAGTFAMYLFYKESFVHFMMAPLFWIITPLHILWAIFMFMMVKHIFPTEKLVTMALKKSEKKEYIEKSGYSELKLYQFVQNQNRKAWMVMLCWLIFNAVFGVLYLIGIMDEADLLMLTVFYFLCDYICILFYCPFQSFIMKNKCCVNCRIYDWGHFMMFTPMLFIRNFFSWSLFFTSCVVLLRWELYYARHPERFWYGSNRNLNCVNCKDQICKYKGKCISE